MTMHRPEEYLVAGPIRDAALQRLEASINIQLRRLLEMNESRGSEFLARSLVTWVEEIVQSLNTSGYDFGRIDYGGDVDYKNSEQTWADGAEFGTGILLTFRGFACTVEWCAESDIEPL
jgi:hypothetical protein